MNIINCNQLFDQLINFIDLEIFRKTKYVRLLYFEQNTSDLCTSCIYQNCDKVAI